VFKTLKIKRSLPCHLIPTFSSQEKELRLLQVQIKNNRIVVYLVFTLPLLEERCLIQNEIFLRIDNKV
jgi:hypothetical protein